MSNQTTTEIPAVVQAALIDEAESIRRLHDEYMSKREPHIQRLLSQGMPFIQAMIAAGDLVSADHATELVKAGEPASKVLYQVGSYARFDWAVANLPRDELLRKLPELWRGADPDDTRPEYLALWKEAFAANGGVTILDSDKALPGGMLKVYRGQVGGGSLGVSWSLSRRTAAFFAGNGGMRCSVKGGRIYTARVHASKVMAYITKRNEEECIVDPNSIELLDNRRRIEHGKV